MGSLRNPVFCATLKSLNAKNLVSNISRIVGLHPELSQ